MYNILNTENALIKENIWCTRIEVTLKLKDIQAASVSWIYIYLYNQCLSPLKLWVLTPFMARCTRYNKHYVIKFVSDLRQVGEFHRVPRFAKALDLSSNGRMPSYFKYL
jgi:hypothetical protein